MKKVYTLVMTLLTSLSFQAQDLKINEFMASNSNTIADENGNFEDWIEIYNPNNFEVDLAGYFISDATDNPQKYRIPETSEEAKIPANGFLLIWADSKSHLGHLHTNFKLSASGDDILLSDANGNLIDSYTFGSQTTDISEGRATDGADNWVFFNVPTPGASNNTTPVDPDPEPNPSNKKVIYYWHFNNLDTSTGDVTEIPADYKAISSATPKMTYTGSNSSGRDMDHFNTGSSINLSMGESDGKAVRVRNESENRSLAFDLPTNGHEDIIFEYAVHRSGQGMLKNIIAYSIDGTNFIQTNLSSNSFDVTENYSLISVDFSDISGVKNNANFKVRITFEGNTNIPDGNNRFDNITLKGTEMELAVSNLTNENMLVYPNPFENQIKIQQAEPFNKIKIVDLSGKTVFEDVFTATKSKTIQVSELNRGIYFIEVSSHTQKASSMLRK
jgi:hypothetical protein